MRGTWEGLVRTRILIVDDEPTVLRAMRRMFDGHVAVDLAANVGEALARLAETTYDTVITDDAMPNRGNGRALLREVRERFPAVFRVLMSAGDVASEHDPPWDRFVQKPFDREAMCLALAPRRGG